MREIKNRYKSNTFEIEFENIKGNPEDFLTEDIKVIEKKTDNDTSKIKIRAEKSDLQNKILSAFIPHTRIISFNEILPTMNEIFISKVNEKNNVGNN